jgi:hypothetical protein
VVTFDIAAAGGRYCIAGWPDHRSSKFGPWPVVSGTGAPEASGARVLASGLVVADGLSGLVLWVAVGAAKLSFGMGGFWADAMLKLASNAATATIALSFLMGLAPPIRFHRERLSS